MLLPSLASAQITGQGFQVQNHGAFLGHAGTLNCGTNITCMLVGGIVTLNGSGGGGGTVTGSGTTNVFPIWTNGPGSVLGDSVFQQAGGGIVPKGFTSNGSIGFNAAHYAEVLSDGAAFSSGLFGGLNATLTYHSPADNAVPIVFFNDSDGQNSFVGVDSFGTFPNNSFEVFFGDGAGGFAAPSVHFTPTTSMFTAPSFAVGNALVNGGATNSMIFNVGNTIFGEGQSRTFAVVDGDTTGVGANMLILIRNQTATIQASNTTSTVTASVKGELVDSNTAGVATMESTDPTSDISLNLYSAVHNSGFGSLALTTSQSGAGTAPEFQFWTPAGLHSYVSFRAPDTTASNLGVKMVLPSAYPATSGFPLVSTTAGVLSFSALANSALTNSSVTLNGTSNQINTTSASVSLGGSATLSLSSTLVAPGSLTVTTRTGTPATMAVFTSGGVLAETTLPSSGTVTSIATTSPITGGTITSTGTIACATCVTSAASLTSTAVMTGAGSQASQTPSATSTLDSSGNMVLAGGLTVTGLGGGGTQMVTASNTGVLGVQAIPGTTTALTYSNCPPGFPCAVSNAIVVNSLTSRVVTLHSLPFQIAATQIQIGFGSATTPGTMRVCGYSESGATKLFDTTLTPVASSWVTATISATLGPGNIYIAAGCATTCNVQALSTINPSNQINTTSNPTGKPIWNGTVTHASGGCDSSLGTITGATTSPMQILINH